MSDSSRAAFLSYASQDADAAKRICDALRAAGVEVWFDQSELVGGDAWDQKIRGQVKTCALFVPVISANTQARLEGYFRLEWKLAAQRTHTMADAKPFLLPIVIDDTRDADAHVPEEFRAVQWTSLPAGETSEKFCARVKKLLGGEEVARAFEHVRLENAGLSVRGMAKAGRRIPVAALVGGAVLLAVAGVMVLAPWRPGAHSAAGAAPMASNSPSAAAAPLAEARQLASKARKLFENRSDTADDCALAEDYCKQALKLAPDESDVWAVYSQLCSLTYLHGYDQSPARLELARTQADRALKLQPRSTEARFSKATVLRLLGEASLGEAEKMLRELSIETPDDSRVWISLGKVICRSNAGLNGIRKNLVRADEALACFDRAAAIPAGRAEGLCERGVLLYQLGRFDEAEAATDESLWLEPVIRVVANKAGLAIRRGDFAAAQAALKRLPDEVRQDDDVVLTMAWVWLCSGMGDQCLDVLNSFPRDYLSGNPFRTPTDSMRGYAYEVAGKTAAAHSARQTALQVVEHRLGTQPHDAALLLEHANLLGLLGEREKARAALKLYDETYPGPYFNESWELWVIAAHATVDSPDATIDRLEVLFGDQHTAALQASYFFPMLRDHPRFKALLAKVAPMPNAKVASEALAVVDAKSVAVLAFANLSDDKANEYFSDGISEELLTVLQKIPGLHVAARTSAFSFKGKNATAQEIGAQLGVAHLVEGSVQKIGNRVKISARLSRAATGEQLWSENYTRDLADVFAVQSEIAQTIVAQLRGQLTGESTAAVKAEIQAQVQAAEKGGTKSVGSHELYLEGRFLATRSGSADVARGIEYYEQALKLDPDYAVAWAALARARLWQLSWEPLNPARAQQARIAAERALAIDADLAEAHSVLSQVMLRYSYEWRAAREASARALALAPMDAAVITDAAATEQALGSLERSIELARRAVALDPVSVDTRFYLAMSCLFIGRLTEAETETRRMIELSSTGIYSRAVLSMILLSQGRAEEALAAAKQEPEEMYRLAIFAMTHHALGQKSESDAALQTLLTKFSQTSPYGIALAHASRDERDQAFEWLERAYQLHDSGVSWLRVDSGLKPLHDDPRWPAFLRKIGLSDEQLK